MSLPDALAGLLSATAYPHRCGTIEVVETHISWVILTGDFVYKLKKPVKFSFLDFSTLEQRAHYCREELRCNRRFAPSLYMDVVPVTGAGQGLRVSGGGKVLEWSVKMRQFPAEAQLDRLLAHDAVGLHMLRRFGGSLARVHRDLPAERLPGDELSERVLSPAAENYTDLEPITWIGRDRLVLEQSRSGMARQVERHRALMSRRLESGCIRECHGDLHLANLVLLEGEVTAFDCIEFNPALRWIDPVSDVAFLFMDCLVRGRPDLGYGFVDGYLDECGDYEGATLLPFYASYRSMVRAKVAALRREQSEPGAGEALEQRFRRHAAWAADWLARPAGRLVLTSGVSASGKSWLAERLAPKLGAVRLRSDIARKVRAGLPPRDPAGAEPRRGLYDPATTAAVYDWLLTLTEDLLRSGEHVIVDATFLRPEQREPFLSAARAAGAGAAILHCHAPVHVLEERIRSRAADGGDPSDAGLPVLRDQLQNAVIPREQTVHVDTDADPADSQLADVARRLESVAAQPRLLS